MEKQPAFEITVVANGYLVTPIMGNRNPAMSLLGQDVHVFNTFESLTEWLKNNLSELSK
jgi:hypothetical protein